MDKRKEATGKDHDRFVECHRLMLPRYLDGKAGRSGNEPDALGWRSPSQTEPDPPENDSPVTD